MKPILGVKFLLVLLGVVIAGSAFARRNLRNNMDQEPSVMERRVAPVKSSAVFQGKSDEEVAPIGKPTTDVPKNADPSAHATPTANKQATTTNNTTTRHVPVPPTH